MAGGPRGRSPPGSKDAVHPALERVKDGGVRTVGDALREGGSDPRDGTDVARLRIAAQPPLLLEEEVLDVGAITGSCSTPRDAVDSVISGALARMALATAARSCDAAFFANK